MTKRVEIRRENGVTVVGRPADPTRDRVEQLKRKPSLTQQEREELLHLRLDRLEEGLRQIAKAVGAES
ncbi:MAG: hypothetical protein ACOY93_13600 [Bacillota bacterium]